MLWIFSLGKNTTLLLSFPNPFPGVDQLQISRFHSDLATRLQADLEIFDGSKMAAVT